MESQIKAFGCMTANIGAAIGVKTAIQTTNEATKTLDQQCHLQKEQARMLGGIGEDSGHGLIALELNTQIASAQSAGTAIQDEAFGSLASGIVAAIGTAASMGAFAKVGTDADMETELSNAESFKAELNKNDEAELEMGEVDTGPDSALKKMQEDERIAKWRGNDTKEPDFSHYKKESDHLSTEEKQDLIINKRALARVKSDPDLKTEISHNIDRTILRLKAKIADHRTQKQNSVINLLSQGTNSASSIAQSGGHMGQASETSSSQIQSAYGSLLEKAAQQASQQAGAAAQQASSIQGEIANLLQNIAFPA